MMSKKTIDNVELNGKKVVMRVDFNVPLENGKITDDTRISAALPTIKAVLAKGAALILTSHLGRPDGKKSPEFSLKVTADHLAKLLGQPVRMAPDCLGPEVKALAAALKPGEVLMLENTRFHAAEEAEAKDAKKKTKKADEALTAAKASGNAAKVKDAQVAYDRAKADEKVAKAQMKEQCKAMAKELAALGNVYVNDAFGTAHRAHASTAVIAEFMPVAVAGYLMAKEIRYLDQAVNNPQRPFVAIIGGAKISGKLEVLQSLLKKVNTLLIGGAMAYTFLKAQGRKIGTSLSEPQLEKDALATLGAAAAGKVKLLLPVDHVVSNGTQTEVVTGDIPDGWAGLDIGPEPVKLFAAEIARAKTIVWNGPMGKFEDEKFAKGTMAVCRAVADANAVSIIGGGDSVSAVNQSGLADKMTHISTGGGASLEYLEGKVLPGIACLNDR